MWGMRGRISQGLDEELHAFNDFWEKDIQYSSGSSILIYYPISSGQSKKHIQ